MPGPSLHRVRMRAGLFALSLLVLVPSFALNVATALAARDRARVVAQETAASLAVVLAAHLEGVFTSTHQILAAVAFHNGVIVGGPRCEDTLQDMRGISPAVTGFSLASASGAVTCGSPQPTGPVTLEATSLRQLAEGDDFVLGAPMLGPLSERMIVLASHAVRNTASDLVGVINAGVDLTNLSALGQRLDLPPGGTALVLHGTGIVVARYPDPERWIGRRVADSELVQALQGAVPNQRTIEAVGLDGVPRLYGYVTLEHGGARFFVTVGFDREDVYAEADRLVRRSAVSFGVVGLFALLAVMTVANAGVKRPVTQMLAATRRIAAGDYRVPASAPGGFREFDDLARGIGVMSAALSRRELANAGLLAQVREQHQRLARLSRRLLDVHETERRALARDLHDDIGQALTAVKLSLQSLRQELPSKRQQLSASIDIAGRTLDHVRSMSLGLRPPMLDHLGLEATLRWYVLREAERASLRAALDIHLPARLAGSLEVTLFRITQEALTNVVRHAQASEVCIHVSTAEGRVHLRIDDNGRGFDVRQAGVESQGGRSVGLLGMEERALLAGGDLEVRSTGSGASVTASFPVTDDGGIA